MLFFEKKSLSSGGSDLRPPQSYPHQLYTATKRSNFVVSSD